MKKIAVLISGSGSNLQALIDRKDINGEIKVVVSNKEEAFGLKRAKNHNIDNFFLPNKGLSAKEYGIQLKELLSKYEIDLVVLAGFLAILSEDFISCYKNKIINIHPSLIPSFCGHGYYGNRVHKAVYDKGVKYSGATVHFVDEGVDSGYIINQEAVRIEFEDSVSDIAEKVLKIEHKILSQSVKDFCDDRIKIIDNRVYIEKE